METLYSEFSKQRRYLDSSPCIQRSTFLPLIVIGLTDEVKRAIPEAVSKILKEIGINYGTAYEVGSYKGGETSGK